MSERVTNILGYTTLIAILAAIWVMFGEDPSRDQGGRGEPTFAGMLDRINQTHTIILSRGPETVTLVRDAGVWGVQERAGYPAETEAVRAFLKGIALSERREPKTANESRFDQLELDTVAGTDITLKDDTDGLLLAFRMGKRTSNASGRSLTYIVQKTDTRAWLVTGLEQATANPAQWLDKALLDLNEKRIRDVTVGGAWLTRKAGDTDYNLQALRAEEKAAPAWKLAEPARVLSDLSLTDVKAIQNPLAEPAGRAEFSTYDGLTVSLDLYDMDGSLWARVKASFDADSVAEGMAESAAQTEAKAISTKATGWLFKLSEPDSAALMQKRPYFLQETTE